MVQARQIGDSGAHAKAAESQLKREVGAARSELCARQRARMRLTAPVAQSTQTWTSFGRSAGILGR